jgi:pimeloyl-ACP methyl ester carboxylesterase
MTNGTDSLATRHGEIAWRSLGSGPALLLTQRFRGTMDDWDPAFLAALAEERRVVLFDSSGIGRSGGEVPDSIAGMAQVAADVAAGLSLGQVDLLGWSLGGLVAQQAALDHPGLVRRLIVAGSSPGGIVDGPAPHPRVQEVMLHPVNAEADFLFLFFPETATAIAEGRAHLARLPAERGPPVSGPAFLRQVKAFSQWPGVRDRLKELAMPVLVANGAHDVMIPAYRSYVLSQEAPQARLALYPDAGHGFLFQDSCGFAREVLRFLR